MGRLSTETKIKSDLAKVDGHEVSQAEYDEIPELTDEMIARAKFYVRGKLVRHDDPASAEAGETVSIRLSPKVLNHFRASGAGWQTRINEILLDVARREGAVVED